METETPNIMTFDLILFGLWLQVMTSGNRRCTYHPTVYRKTTATVPETRVASSHLNVQKARRTQSRSQTSWTLNVITCQMDTLTIGIWNLEFSVVYFLMTDAVLTIIL